MKEIVYQNKRSVLELEKSGVLKTTKYVHEIKEELKEKKKQWKKKKT